MKIWTTLLIALATTMNSFVSNAQDFMKNPPKSITFAVIVKDAQEPIQGAYIEVLMQDAVVIQNVTDASGNAKLGIPEYRKQPVVIRVTVPGYKQKEMRNLIPEQDGMYTLTIQQGSGLDVEEAKVKEVVAATPTTIAPKSKKQLKKERKQAKKALKVEEAYRAELAEIKKELSEVQSTRGRLQGSLQAIEENVKKGSLSESEAQKRRDKINQDITNTNDKEKQLEEKIKALDRKYGKV